MLQPPTELVMFMHQPPTKFKVRRRHTFGQTDRQRSIYNAPRWGGEIVVAIMIQYNTIKKLV